MNFLPRLLSILLILCLPLTVFAQIRILCIGDSITQGRKGNPSDSKFAPTLSYRYPLWKMLIDAKIPGQFVGGNEGGFEGAPVYPAYKGLSFVNRHEAYWGWTTKDVGEKVVEHREKNSADFALILLGANDDVAKNGSETTLKAMTKLVGTLRGVNSKVTILLAGPFMEWAPNPEIRTAYEKLATQLTKKGSPVVFVPAPKGWISNPDEAQTCTVDWVHPNGRGDELLAKEFFLAIQKAIAKSSK